MSASTSLPVISAGAAGIRLQIRVMPRASKAAVAGVREGRLIVRVTAPPVDNAANDAVVELLSSVLDLPRRALSIVSGHSAREKTIVAAGITEADARRRLGIRE